MNLQPPNLEDLQDRLLKLEKQNRRFKELGLGVALVIGTLLLMGQARPQSTPQASSRTLEAEKLILRDPQGKTWAELDAAGIKFFAEDGSSIVRLAARKSGPDLELFGPDGNLAAVFDAVKAGPQLRLFGPGGDTVVDLRATVDDSAMQLTAVGDKGSVHIHASTVGPDLELFGPGGKSVATFDAAADGPSLNLTDGNGFKSILGVENLVVPSTGETDKISAASLTLFDNKNKVIWKAP